MSTRLDECKAEIARAGRFLDARGWMPATSGNISMRLDPERIAITESGVAKGTITDGQVLVVDRQGRATDDRRSSAETSLHWEVYERDPSVGAVVHTHSRIATLLSRAIPAGESVALEGYELLKAFAGIRTHDARVDVVVVENDQDVEAMARAVRTALSTGSRAYGYLIRGHGLYAWGADMAHALRHVEALEFLLSCSLEERWRGR